MKTTILNAALILLTSVMLISCSKSSNGPMGGTASRKVKYEITGNFSGKLDVVYSDNVSGNTALTDIVSPWSKEIQYGNNVASVGIGAQAKTVGVAGQTATLKIYSNGVVVKTSTATAGAMGQLLLPTISFGF